MAGLFTAKMALFTECCIGLVYTTGLVYLYTAGVVQLVCFRKVYSKKTLKTACFPWSRNVGLVCLHTASVVQLVCL